MGLLICADCAEKLKTEFEFLTIAVVGKRKCALCGKVVNTEFEEYRVVKAGVSVEKMKTEIGEYSDEAILLRADEAIKQSNGFILFVVDQDGGLWTIANTTHLNQAEVVGLDAFRKRDMQDLGERSGY